MDTKAERRFNLVDEDWIPVAGAGKVSLRRIFADSGLSALGGNPVEKIALTKLLLAIAQAAYTPENDVEWKETGKQGMADKALVYLEKNRDCFWLYGDRPFLQMPAIAKAEVQSFSAVLPDIATGNTTVLIESQIERSLSDAEKVMLIIFLSGFALGGKKTDNKIILTPEYAGKSNDKGKPSTGKPGPSIGFAGYMHSFLAGGSICETIWLNLITKEHIQGMGQFSRGIGTPPWELMPIGENCPVAMELKESFMGRLIPMSRFALISEKGIHYSEGILHPSYKEGGFDLSIAVDFSAKDPRALWIDPDRRPWRQLTALLSFFSSENNASKFNCDQLRLGLFRARKAVNDFRIWSGGLRVSSNAGEQFVSGSDDFVESEVTLQSYWLGAIWFTNLKGEMEIMEEISKNLYGATMSYFKHQKTDGKKHAAQATHLFWQLSERQFQALVNACGDETGREVLSMRRLFLDYANKAYNMFCPRDTARQIDAWAACRPNLSRFLPDDRKTVLHNDNNKNDNNGLTQHDVIIQEQSHKIDGMERGKTWKQQEMF